MYRGVLQETLNRLSEIICLLEAKRPKKDPSMESPPTVPSLPSGSSSSLGRYSRWIPWFMRLSRDQFIYDKLILFYPGLFLPWEDSEKRNRFFPYRGINDS